MVSRFSTKGEVMAVVSFGAEVGIDKLIDLQPVKTVMPRTKERAVTRFICYSL
jgi:hypothetical protein